MKSLSLEKMESSKAGLSCKTAWGLSFGLIAVGGFLAPFTFGASLLLSAAGSAVGTGNVVNNCLNN